ncbi:MAG: hypothetical protein QM655_17265 [Nocardioidaceae bacterium]
MGVDTSVCESVEHLGECGRVLVALSDALDDPLLPPGESFAVAGIEPADEHPPVGRLAVIGRGWPGEGLLVVADTDTRAPHRDLRQKFRREESLMPPRPFRRMLPHLGAHLLGEFGDEPGTR